MRVPADDRPIGVFDSGVGGLTVVDALTHRLPGESILYLGDTARLPYGTKSPATVRRYAEKNVRFLLERDVKAIVIACNTASALALGALAAPVPIWGVIQPGAAAAAKVSRGRVGIIATESTIASDAYTQAIRALRPDLAVWSRACGLFVPLVEEGWIDDPVTVRVARRYLEPLIDARIDTLVLGCTHYPLLRRVIARIVGEEMGIIDSAKTAAETVADALDERRLAPAEGQPVHHLCVTDASRRFEAIASTVLRRDVQLELVDV